jgi:hypothetical protein
MKLINLIPLKELAIEDVSATEPEMIATPYFREFQTAHGYKPLFKYIGNKGEQMIFVADLTDFGALDMIITDAKLFAKVTEKEATFGIVYTLTGLEQFDATVCKMKQKNGQIERMMFDNKDKKNFDAKTTNFVDLLDKQ